MYMCVCACVRVHVRVVCACVCVYLHVKALVEALLYMMLWFNYNVMDMINIVMFYVVIISNATHEFLPRGNKDLLNWIELPDVITWWRRKYTSAMLNKWWLCECEHVCMCIISCLIHRSIYLTMNTILSSESTSTIVNHTHLIIQTDAACPKQLFYLGLEAESVFGQHHIEASFLPSDASHCDNPSLQMIPHNVVVTRNMLKVSSDITQCFMFMNTLNIQCLTIYSWLPFSNSSSLFPFRIWGFCFLLIFTTLKCVIERFEVCYHFKNDLILNTIISKEYGNVFPSGLTGALQYKVACTGSKSLV